MSCVDAKDKIADTQVIKIEIDEQSASGKPCIDFQPDDRWQIKEEKTDKVINNSKANDNKISNNRKSQHLNNSKSSEVTSSVNGDVSESNSEDESEKKVSETEDDSKGNDKVLTKRKRLESKVDSEVIECSGVSSKKMKLDDIETSNGIEVKDECEDDSKKIDDLDDKKAMPDLSPAAADDRTSNVEDCDVDSSMVCETNDKEKSTLDPKSDENDCKILPKLDECEIKDTVSKSNEKIVNGNEIQIDKDIEIISISGDGKKSDDDESDSEVQIINSEVKKSKPPIEFPTVVPSDENISLSAGFPYYNSIKEKVSDFKAGEYKPVKFPHTGTLLLAENEVIIESPSLLVPLLIKEADSFPKIENEDKKPSEETSFTKPNMISKKNFFQSSVGQFLINLGMSRVQEWYHRDMKRAKLKQIKKSTVKDEEVEKEFQTHEKRHTELKEINAAFNFRMRSCKFCNFKSESQAVLEGHYLVPHLSMRREYKCNFCTFLTRDPEAIIFHFEAMHGKKAILESYVSFHECIFCSFQSHLKTKVNAHMNRCRKHFIPSQNLAPPFDFEFPGVTTKPVTLQDVVGHKRLLLNSKNQRLPVSEDNSANSAYARKKLASVLSKLSGQNTYADMKNPNIMKQLMTSQTISGSNAALPPGLVITRPRTQMPPLRPVGRFPPPRVLQTNIRGPSPRPNPPYTINLSSAASQLASSGISITPVTRTNAVPPRASTLPGTKNVTLTPINTASNRPLGVNKSGRPPTPLTVFTTVASSNNMMGQPQARLPVTMNFKPLRPAPPYQRLTTPPSQVVKGSSGNTFVMCEICDSYIKDLEELRTHMNWVHKVKIHPKMLVSRPPLNCQKCQWRFFTDQGLERHLLGAHGLVTTNMQEMANKNQDGGRCIICGAVFTYKLVSHMTQVHKVTLKPAHLSYKCTVCTATFTLYRLFESHVYNVHSGSSKRPAEESSSEPVAKKVASEEVGPIKCRECGLVTENMHDHLIKTHLKQCTVKLCHIEKCEKCLYSSDELLVIRMSDFGLEDDLDDSGDEDDDDSDELSDKEDDCSKEQSGSQTSEQSKAEQSDDKTEQSVPQETGKKEETSDEQ